MGEIKTRVVGVIVRKRGVMENVIGHLCEDASAGLIAPVMQTKVSDDIRLLGKAKEHAERQLRLLLLSSTSSLGRC